MKMYTLMAAVCLLSLTACQKKIDSLVAQTQKEPPKTEDFVQYIIKQGEQYCNYSSYQAVNTEGLAFIVKFDSTAIYQTVSPTNQKDINKLFGFSDNNAQHHVYSARFGWRWSDDALRLFAYVYNDSTLQTKEIGTVQLGQENTCSIKVDGEQYLFTINGQYTTMPRKSTTPTAVGYKLYPYFGGDEVAPHLINIWMKQTTL